jgi:hypothetical protein
MDGLDDFLKANAPVDDSGADQVPTDPQAAADPVKADAGDPPADPTPPADPAPTADRPRGPDGKFIAKGDAQPVDPAAAGAPPAPQEPTLDHAALIGERRRRQDAEERYRVLEERLNKLETPAQPAPELWDDPDAYFNHRLTGVMPQLTEQIKAELRADRIRESATEARSKYQDYDQAIDVFHEIAAQNPALYQQMEMARDPAEFAYSKAKSELEIRQHGGLDGLIEARVKAALEKAQPAPVQTPPVPDTLADAQSARGSSAETLHIPTFDEILKR